MSRAYRSFVNIRNKNPRRGVTSRRILLLAVLGLAAIFAGAYIAIRLAMRGPLAGETSHDFGIVEVYPGETTQLTHNFHLTNPRTDPQKDEPIIIQAVRPECGCVRPVKGRFTIQPGESIDLPIIMDFKGGDKTVLIHLDLAESGWQVLKVHAQSKFLPHLYTHAEKVELARDKPAILPIMADVYETEQAPAEPKITTPAGVTAKFSGWRSTWKPKDNHTAPCQWEGHIELHRAGDAGEQIEPDAAIVIEAKGMRQLRVPLSPLP